MQLEKAQRMAARLALNNYKDDYKKQLKDLGWWSIDEEARLARLQLARAYSYGQRTRPMTWLTERAGRQSARTSHDRQMKFNFGGTLWRTRRGHDCSLHRIVTEWNRLPQDMLLPNKTKFKRKVIKYICSQ